ncbi:MAG: WG repeat-containing protein [Daejeonella sp.]
MKTKILHISKYIICITLFFNTGLFAQKNDSWIRFQDKKTELFGYKDLKGNIKIPASLNEGFGVPDTFNNIIGVTEDLGKDRPYEFYYLLKNGKKVGRDSVYISSDLYFDCENEDKIKFKDSKKDKVGFFNKSGKVIIPAIYNDVSPFYNGVSLVLINAEKEYLIHDGGGKSEHWYWKGGKKMLINDKNEILIDSCKLSSTINWYSMEINRTGLDTAIYVSLKGENNKIYSFMDYKKEFNKWFFSEFITSIDQNKLINHYFEKITFWDEEDGWISEKSNKFVAEKGNILKQKFKEIEQKKFKYFIAEESLNQFIFEKKIYKRYYNSCGEFKKEQYPVFEIVVDHPDIHGKLDYQESFSFIRPGKGYHLFHLSLKNRK